MTGADILLDTNALIAWMGKDRDFARAMLSWSVPAISLFTLGYLLFRAPGAAALNGAAQIR